MALDTKKSKQKIQLNISLNEVDELTIHLVKKKRTEFSSEIIKSVLEIFYPLIQLLLLLKQKLG